MKRFGRWLVTHKRGEEEAAFAVDTGWLAFRLAGALGVGASVASAAILATSSTSTAPRTAVFHPSYPLSTKAVAFIERHEGVRYVPYPDPGGRHICTVGAGHVLSWTVGCTVKQLATTYTPAQVAAFLVSDTNAARACITRSVTAHIGQPEYEALVDLVFNAGCGSLYYRNVIGLVNAGALAQLPAAWEQTAVTASGVYLAGLAQRRIDEIALALHGYYGPGIGYFVSPKPLTRVERAELALRERTGYYAWLAWYLHEGAWRAYAVHAPGVRPRTPHPIPAAWWRRERAFLAARHHSTGGSR